MKSKVYFIPVRENDTIAQVQAGLQKLIQQSNLFSFLAPEQTAVVKLHFGEQGNTGHVKPDYVRVICDGIKQKKAVPLLSDTNTLYKGRRTNSIDHRKLAYEHGFTKEKTGADICIPDEKHADDMREVPIRQEYIAVAKVAALYSKADAIIGVAHFKGHLMTGFGGALKNIGMGCASREGKLAQHSDVAPIVRTGACTGCGACREVCPVDAITIERKKAHIDKARCIGCASCIAACNFYAVDVDWESGGAVIQEKMAEYAYAVLQSKKGKQAFINFATKITRECDCLAKDDPRIAADVGIFASDDPVAVDAACYDAIIKSAGRDVLKEAHPARDGRKQLRHAAQLGVGSLDYELIAVPRANA